MQKTRWLEPDWLAEVHAWIGDRLAEHSIALTDEIEQPHIYPWSTVLRIPTDAGTLWFKATVESLKHEVAIVDRIAARRPDVITPLLASRAETGWMLMADAGESLRIVTAREGSLDRWLRILPLYAEVQLDLAPDVDDLLALGVPDLRLAALPAAYDRLMDQIGAEARFRAAAPWIAEQCEALAGYGLPELLQHDDLHDGQVFVNGGGHQILDWGDACISHPFFTLAVTLDGNLAWGLDDVEHSVDTGPFRDAYLAPFVERFDGDLVAAATTAMRLGWACRAVNGHVPGDEAHTVTRLKMLLDGTP